jgi:phosphoribosylamine--glycine ligase
VFDPGAFANPDEALPEFKKFTAQTAGFVIKPDAPARGAGVGVSGSDFRSDAEASAFFVSAFSKGRVVVEEKVEGEESSFHAFSDGKHFVPAPLTRDYKRRLDGDRGRLTGGMGSYRNTEPHLPFPTRREWEILAAAEERAFRRWKGKGSEPGLRGIVLYDAIMHGGRGFKVLERNSRGGNTEVVNILTTMRDDFIDVCYRILDGRLRQIRFKRASSVVTCAVPVSYGEKEPASSGPQTVGLEQAYKLSSKSGGSIRVYPMDGQASGGDVLMGSSRTVAVVGLGDSIGEARARSLRGVRALSGPLLWRKDLASRPHIARSISHMKSMRKANA